MPKLSGYFLSNSRGFQFATATYHLPVGTVQQDSVEDSSAMC